MRNMLDAIEGVVGAVMAWAVIGLAAHWIYEQGYDAGYDARDGEDAAPAPLNAAPDPDPETTA